MSTLTNMWNGLRAFYEGRNEPENIRPLADLYWRVVISISVALVVCVLMYGVWIFVGVITVLSAGSSASSSKPPVALDRKQLESTLAAFDARAAELESAKTSPSVAADPSK